MTELEMLTTELIKEAKALGNPYKSRQDAERDAQTHLKHFGRI